MTLKATALQQRTALEKIAAAADELGATHYLATWGGHWARRETVSEALKALPGTRKGEDALVIPCGAEGFLDDHGRIYPKLGLPPGTRLTAFIGRKAVVKGVWFIADPQAWS